MAFEGGTIDGGAAAWKVKLTNPMPLELDFTAKIDGDSIAGDVAFGAFGKGTFEATRG